MGPIKAYTPRYSASNRGNLTRGPQRITTHSRPCERTLTRYTISDKNKKPVETFPNIRRTIGTARFCVKAVYTGHVHTAVYTTHHVWLAEYIALLQRTAGRPAGRQMSDEHHPAIARRSPQSTVCDCLVCEPNTACELETCAVLPTCGSTLAPAAHVTIATRDRDLF